MNEDMANEGLAAGRLGTSREGGDIHTHGRNASGRDRAFRAEVLSVREHPELADAAVRWFHSKWSVPEEAYRESIDAAIESAGGVPDWFVVLDNGEIIAGCGIIENDFHKRRDLSPNICAVYVEPSHRGLGIARSLLGHACASLAAHGVRDAYLITDHVGFYERCGWEFIGMVEEEGGGSARMYHHWEKE